MSAVSDARPVRRTRFDQLRGLTLVELLIVIVLVTTLVTTAIPIIAPAGDSRRLREASRNLNAYVQGAQTRAIQTGRPFGVALRRASENTGNGIDNAVVTRVEYVEVPPAYAGFDDASLARVCVVDVNGIRQFALQFVRYGSDQLPQVDRLPAGYDIDLAPDRFFRPGDEVHIGGHVFRFMLPNPPSFGANRSYTLSLAPIYGGDSSAAGFFDTGGGGNLGRSFRIEPFDGIRLTQRLENGNPQWVQTDSMDPNLRLVSWHFNGAETTNFDVPPAEAIAAQNLQPSYFATEAMPYKVYRQPVPAAGEPLEMPAGTAVDLQASVFGDGRRLYDPATDFLGTSATEPWRIDDDPIMILFSPEGSIDRIVGVPSLADRRVKETILSTSSVALLVGSRSQIPADPTIPDAGAGNYAEPIDLQRDVVQAGLSEEEAKELTDQFNWLNLDSRWLVIGSQSGSVSSIDNTAAYVAPDRTAPFEFNEQLSAALENASRRAVSGGR